MSIQHTGTIDFSSASEMKIPVSAAPTVNADGEIALDTTVTDFSHGIVKVYGGEEQGIVSMPIAEFTSPVNGDVPMYNSTSDEFQMTQVIQVPTVVSLTPFPASGRGNVTQRQMNSNTTGYVGSILLPFAITVNKLSIENTVTTVNGTFDIGVYSQDGQTKYIDITTTTVNANQVWTTSVSSVSLSPGIYYVVVVPNSTADATWNVWQSLPNNMLDVSSEPLHSGTLSVTAGTLPATFNPVSDITTNASHGIVVRLDN